MMDQYFGHKELYEVVLRAKEPMQFGSRYIETQEPVLYFNNVNMSLLTEQDRPVFARGGWGNMPRVIWEERSEVQFQMIEGVMSSVGMSILLGANVLSREEEQPLYIHMKEGPFELQDGIDNDGHNCVYIDLRHHPVSPKIKKTFIFEYERDAIQQKLYGKRIMVQDPFDSNLTIPRIAIYKDKKCLEPAEKSRKYVIDYYYEYRNEALIYSVQKERFNGIFTLEAKFYSKDENEGQNYTNLLYMPKVRIVSSINLRLGERADPTVSTFNIIGMPETVGDQNNLIVEIKRLNQDIDADI